MVSLARIEQSSDGWRAKVDWGRTTEVHGPYRWRWMARLVAWLEDGQH